MSNPTATDTFRPCSKSCRVCGNTEGNRLHAVREMLFGSRETFEYFECAACQCVQILDIPADMGRHYPPGYYSYAEADAGPPAGARHIVMDWLKRRRERYAALRQGWPGGLLQMFMPERTQEVAALGVVGARQDSRILDVGCGSGRLLYKLRAMGFDHLSGIDPYNQEDSNRHGVPILKRELIEMQGTWDIIMFHHVFEHLPDPETTLRLVHERLAPGGSCLIRIPTVSSWAWKHYGVNWYALDAPRHFFLHSRESVRLLAERTGLRLKEVIYDSHYQQFLGSESYQHDLSTVDEGYRQEKARLFPPATVRGMMRRAKHLNETGQGDQACFFLEKAAVAATLF